VQSDEPPDCYVERISPAKPQAMVLCALRGRISSILCSIERVPLIIAPLSGDVKVGDRGSASRRSVRLGVPARLVAPKPEGDRDVPCTTWWRDPTPLRQAQRPKRLVLD
jgi:hypothetical protein